MEIEIKGKDGTKTIPLEDIRIQIKEIEMKIQPITEPRIRFKLPRYQIAGVVITPVKDVMMTPAFYFQGVVFFAKEQGEEFGDQNRQVKTVITATNQETMSSGKTSEQGKQNVLKFTIKSAPKQAWECEAEERKKSLNIFVKRLLIWAQGSGRGRDSFEL